MSGTPVTGHEGLVRNEGTNILVYCQYSLVCLGSKGNSEAKATFYFCSRDSFSIKLNHIVRVYTYVFRDLKS